MSQNLSLDTALVLLFIIMGSIIIKVYLLNKVLIFKNLNLIKTKLLETLGSLFKIAMPYLI